MQSLMLKIKDAIEASGINELTVIYNGSYLMYHSKLVHARLNTAKSKDVEDADTTAPVQFYTKEVSLTDAPTSSVMAYSFVKLYDLCSDLRHYRLFDSDVAVTIKDPSFDLDQVAKVSVNDGLQFLIIESAMYSIAKSAIMENVSNGTVENDAYTIDAMTLNRMKTIFELNSYSTYKKFLNIRYSRKIINRFLDKHSFYSIQRAFIPMFISIKGIYNPLLDNPRATAVHNSDLYKTAMEKNRLLDIGGYMQAYMMTHLEICKSFHLTNFMRFTPLFAYEVLGGLILPNSSHFPNNTKKVFMTYNVSTAKLYNLKSYYSQQDFAMEISDLLKQLESVTGDTATELRDKYEFLSSYSNAFTMEVYLQKEYKRLVSFASLPFDERVDVKTLGTYLLKASLN